MKKISNQLKVICGALAGIIIGGVSVVCANQAIQAIQNTQIKVSLNGQIQEFKDETTDETQYPITYNSRTYLPLRTIANLIGIDIDYDSTSNTAMLSSNKNITNYKSYDEILEKIKAKTQVESNYYDKFLSINYMEICDALDSGNLYYKYLDLNNDGTEELIIYDTSYETPLIYGVFTKYNNAIYESIVGWSRSSYSLREGYIFEHVGSSGASDSEFVLGAIRYHEFDEFFKLHITDETSELVQKAKKEYDDIIAKHPLIKLDGAQIIVSSFNDILGVYKTTYNSSNINRTTNLELACNNINGTVLNPNEKFSFNEVVGERTAARGFKMAKSIVQNGEVGDAIGGGISQVSSTLYNAILLSDLEVAERKNNMYWPEYVNPSLDATVEFSGTDLIFLNNRNYPVKIEATAKNGFLTCTIYGKKEQDELKVQVDWKVLETYEPTTITRENESLGSGQTMIMQSPVKGYKSEAYRVYLDVNGNEIKREKVSTDNYRPLSKIIEIGK